MRWSMLAMFAALASPAMAADPGPAMNARVFDRAWSLVDRRYWDPAKHGIDWAAERARSRAEALAAADSGALYRILNGMLGRLGDSHVFAVPPAEVRYQAAADRPGPRPGYGFGSYLVDGRWEIYAVAPGSPAARAGVEIGWRLVSIDGQPPDIDTHPRADTPELILFEDEAGRRHALRLTAVDLPNPAARSARRLPGGLLLLQLDAFTGDEARWIERQIADASPAGVILDLRENDGGEAEAVAHVAGLFFSGRHTFLLRVSGRREERAPVLRGGRQVYAGPLAVLVGPRSASAAEALAAALGEAGRAITVGQRTAGALTAASEYRLPDGGLLSLAESDVRTPGGARIEGVGYTPALMVVPTLAELRAGRDPVLTRAEAALTRAAAPARSAS